MLVLGAKNLGLSGSWWFPEAATPLGRVPFLIAAAAAAALGFWWSTRPTEIGSDWVAQKDLLGLLPTLRVLRAPVLENVCCYRSVHALHARHAWKTENIYLLTRIIYVRQ